MDDPSSSLLCQENETCLEGGEVGDEDYSFIQFQSQDYSVLEEEEYVGILIEREIGLGFRKDETLVFGNWVRRARMDAINWILKTRATLGFRLQTAYLSVSYFDRFLSRRSIDSEKYWAIRLLSVACLSLAAKMEECNVTALSEFQLEDYCFGSKVIQRMELLVLSTLEWDMGIITPFAFLPYFSSKFCNESPPSHTLSKTMQLIFITMKEVNLMDHKPSVIAAAATLVELDQPLTIEAVELKISQIPQYRFLEPKEIFECYNLIRRLYLEKTKRDKLVHSPDPSPIRSKPIDMIESSLATKRRRLNFNDDDDDDDESRDGKGHH